MNGSMLQAETPAKIGEVVMYALYGLVYGLVGAFKNIDNVQDIDPLRLLKPALVGVVAGVIMSSQGDNLTPEAYIGAAAVAVPIVDMLLNMALPESAKGTPGTGWLQRRPGPGSGSASGNTRGERPMSKSRESAKRSVRERSLDEERPRTIRGGENASTPEHEAHNGTSGTDTAGTLSGGENEPDTSDESPGPDTKNSEDTDEDNERSY